MPDLPPWIALTWWTAMGLFVGSFLNVCIHRFPLEDQSVNRPRRSYCPSCGTQLRWTENVPVLSWLVLRGRCRTCGARIHWRYPLVELLNGALWLAAYLATPQGDWGLLVVRSVVLSGLVVATFVDFDRYEIPDQVSIGGMFAAPVAAWFVPALHADTVLAQRMADGGPVDGVAALVGCLAGMAVGGGVLYAIGWLGTRVYRAEAMGFGDVKLMAAGGGFVGPGGVLAALLVAVLVGSVVGVGNIVRFYCEIRRRDRRRGRPFGRLRAARVARLAGRYLPFGPYLALGIGIALLAWEDLARVLPFGTLG